MKNKIFFLVIQIQENLSILLLRTLFSFSLVLRSLTDTRHVNEISSVSGIKVFCTLCGSEMLLLLFHCFFSAVDTH